MLASSVYNFFKEKLKETDHNYFEIGVYFGDGVHELAKDFPDKKIYCVDPFIEDGFTVLDSNIEKGQILNSQRENALKLFGECSNIIFHETTSQQFLRNLTKQQINEFNVSHVFIDGDHSYDGASNDYVLAMKLIANKKGVIVFDDTDLPGVGQAIEVFKRTYPKRITSEFHGVDPRVVVFEIGNV